MVLSPELSTNQPVVEKTNLVQELMTIRDKALDLAKTAHRIRISSLKNTLPEGESVESLTQQAQKIIQEANSILATEFAVTISQSHILAAARSHALDAISDASHLGF